jgi:hypothetical protein
VRVWLDAIWSRLDQGFGVEALHKSDTVRSDLDAGQPIRMEIVERCLEGENKGLLRTGSPAPPSFLPPFTIVAGWLLFCRRRS